MEHVLQVVNCPELGDHVISNQDFDEGEFVFQEKPILTSPTENCKVGESEFCCVGCCKIVPESSLKCPKCLFPICSFVCTKESLHSQLECKIFESRTVPPTTIAYNFIKYVRILLSRSVCPKQYQKFVKLSAEFELSIGEEIIRSAGHEESIVAWKFLTEDCGLIVSISEVTEMWKALKINCFSIPSEDQAGQPCRGLAVYEYGCKLSHSCSSNLQWYLEKKELDNGSFEWSFIVFSTRAIKRGDILSIGYVPDGMDYGTARRKQMMPLNFDCLCSRCLDPTEEGTFISSPKCRECKQGFLLPIDPLLSINCPWNCSNCGTESMGTDIAKKTAKLEENIAPFMQRNVCEDSLETLDCFIEEHSGIDLHPNHYILFQTSFYWLTRSNFRDKLMSQSTSSVQLFEKILSRAHRCLYLAGKFLHTFRSVRLEVTVMEAVAAFAFKSSDGGNVDVSHLDRRMKLHFSKMLLKHLSRARFWLVKQSMHYMHFRIASLNELHYMWTFRCESFALDLLNFENENEDSALMQLSTLLN